jgi:hypothetical protein
MVEDTLLAMRRGGIYDHVGFGFHRYSTDAEWQVPHFEKMLYDQALMAIAYTETYQATGKEMYARVVREILDYVLREMTSQEGGFFSAEDADSDGEEGRFYCWTAEELREALDKDDLKLLIRLFDLHESGNFELGRNILRCRLDPGDAASVLKVSRKDLYERLEKIRCRLFLAREKRVHPFKDDKILTDWNGLMIAALAKAAQALQEQRYARSAARAADFILKEMQTDEGRLLHRYRGEAGIAAHLDDYAFLIWGLLDLYETVFEAKYLKAAFQLNQVMMRHFWDKDHGGLFFSADDAEALLLRRKESYDRAIPSGSSISMHNLLRLMHLSGQSELEERAWDLARFLFAAAGGQPLGQSMLLCSLDYALGPALQIALLGSLKDEGMIEMLQALHSSFLPNKSVVLACGEEIREIAPFTKNLGLREGEKVAAYVCRDRVCSLPATSLQEMMQLLK